MHPDERIVGTTGFVSMPVGDTWDYGTYIWHLDYVGTYCSCAKTQTSIDKPDYKQFCKGQEEDPVRRGIV